MTEQVAEDDGTELDNSGDTNMNTNRILGIKKVDRS